MLICPLLFATAILSQTQPDVVVLALGNSSQLAAAVSAEEQAQARAGKTVLAHADVRQILSGRTAWPAVDPQVLRSKLNRARDLEARFDTEGANALRTEVVEAFAHALRPDAGLRRLAATALQDMVAALVADGSIMQARALAREASRRFPHYPLDRTRHAPQIIDLFKAAEERLRNEPRSHLVVLSSAPGEVFLDGASLGMTRGHTVPRSVPPGPYRVWLETESGTSLPHVINLTESPPNQPTTLDIDVVLERCIELQPVVALTCTSAHQAHLATLVRRLGVKQVLGVDGHSISYAPGKPLGVQHPVDAFRLQYLLPLGMAQLSQQRPWAAAAYLTAEIGLAAWHIVALVQHENALANNTAKEKQLRGRRNLTAGLFWGSLVVAGADALIYAAIQRHPSRAGTAPTTHYAPTYTDMDTMAPP